MVTLDQDISSLVSMPSDIITILVLIAFTFQSLEIGSLSDKCTNEISSKSGISQQHISRASRIKDLPCQVIITLNTVRKGEYIHYMWDICAKILKRMSKRKSISKYIDHQKDTSQMKAISHLSHECLQMLPLNAEKSLYDKLKLRKKRQSPIDYLTIIPGTNFCGKGNRSESYTNLGIDPSDICCRAHDICNLYVNAQETKYGYTNNNANIYQAHCHCDQRFYWCLKKMTRIFGEQTSAETINNGFFTTLGMTCFYLKRVATCSRIESRCTHILVGCTDVCVSYTFSPYRGIMGRVDQGEIVAVDP